MLQPIPLWLKQLSAALDYGIGLRLGSGTGAEFA